MPLKRQVAANRTCRAATKAGRQCAAPEFAAAPCARLPGPASPVAGKAYIFPYTTEDLETDEYLTTSANHWANGGVMGTQIFAHDVGCVGWDKDAGAWSEIRHGGSQMKNADWRIYGMTVR